EHRHMGLARGNVLTVKAAVEVDRGVDLLHGRVGAGREATAPHLVAHDTSSLTMTVQPEMHSFTQRRLAVIVAGAIAGVAVGIAAVYGIGGLQRNPVGVACRPAAELAKRLAPLARGEVAAVNVASEPDRLPDLTFNDASGKARQLSEWRDRTVLLNLWATWCVPCRKELPALDALQAKLGSDRFEVVTINIDTRNLDKPKAWLAEAGISRLSYYGDPSAKV